MKLIKPNTNICPICTGQPGSKPMLPNKSAIDKLLQIGLMLGWSEYYLEEKRKKFPKLEGAPSIKLPSMELPSMKLPNIKQ